MRRAVVSTVMTETADGARLSAVVSTAMTETADGAKVSGGRNGASCAVA